jgi:hypothetical protein
LLLAHEELEAPRSFWYWSALCAISAVVKDNIWLDKFRYNLYPNIYVMLHADSGLKKGAPVNLAKQLVRAVNNTTIISGRSSIQGILKKLGTAESLPGGKIVAKSTAFICSSELTSSIVDDKAAMTILTDLYDRNWNEGEWSSLLKMEQFSLQKPTVSSLTATNEAHSEEFFLKKDIQGGYFARTFIIFEKEAQAINSLMFKPKIDFDINEYVAYLKRLAALKGELEMSVESRKYFDDWYRHFKMSIKNVKDKTGTLNRFDDSVLKVAILLSLSEQPEPIITQTAIEEAIRECERLVGNIRKVTYGAGKDSHAAEKGMILRILSERDGHTITLEQLHRNYWMYASLNEWTEIMNQLQAAKVITMEQIGRNVIFTMPKAKADELREYFEGKNKNES